MWEGPSRREWTGSDRWMSKGPLHGERVGGGSLGPSLRLQGGGKPWQGSRLVAGGSLSKSKGDPGQRGGWARGADCGARWEEAGAQTGEGGLG